MRSPLRFPCVLLLATLWSCAETPPPETARASQPVTPPPSTLSAPSATTPHPPVAPKRPVVTDYFGVKVNDDYEWLENAADPEVQAWSQAQNAFTRSFLDALSDRPAVRERVSQLMTSQSAKHYEVRYRGKTLLAMKEQPPKQQPMLVVLKSADDLASERVIVDPNTLDASGKTTIDFYVPSRDGKLVAVSMSQAGSEKGSVHVFEVATGKARPDVVPRVNGGTAGGGLAWNGDATGFYYTRYPREGERPPVDLDFYQQVYFHKLGTDTSADVYAIGKDFPRIAETSLDASDDGKLVLARVGNGDGGDFAFYLRSPSGAWSTVAQFGDKVMSARFAPDGSLYLLSHAQTRGQILRLAPATAPLAKAEVVVPEGDTVIRSFAVTPTKIYVLDLAGGPSQVRVLPKNAGKAGTAIAMPILPVSEVSELERLDGDDVLFRNESYVEPPGWYRYTAKDGKVAKTALVETTSFDLHDAEVTRETCTSKDGTKVPLSVLRRKGQKQDGSAIALLTGYGGYGLSRAPRFRPMTRLWLDQGGVYAEANLRGGGEFGEDWHKAGNLTKKQNVFDDFYGCARFLADSGWTKPEHLAIVGGSNGGLLMGAELVQHPDAYRAVVSFVGIYDMLHVERTPNGAFNVTEFGSVKDPDQFRALYAYSPVHNVKDGTAYPSILFLTGANDPRVDPYQSRKMTARLQAAQTGSHPILLRTSNDTGHGGGTPLSVEIEQNADYLAFLLHELGVGFRAAP